MFWLWDNLFKIINEYYIQVCLLIQCNISIAMTSLETTDYKYIR